VWDEDIDKIYLGDGTRNSILEERKNLDRSDFADRDFLLSLANDSQTDVEITVSSGADVEVGDVIFQTQYLTISQFNRLLLKLDIDSGLDDTDYFSTLKAVFGDNLTNKMNDLNTKLVADDASGTITSTTYSTDFEILQTEFNTLISELNNNSSDPLFDNYKESTGTVPYEDIITEEGSTINSFIITVPETPFIVGPLTIFKGIHTDIQWTPIHFGSSDTLKQVREGTFLFDQDNFYSATALYASDRSQAFEEVPFVIGGPGYWGSAKWGEIVWGGSGSEAPFRTLIPRDKQRCRHMKVRFKHINAREIFRILGISLEPRPLSKRAYR
jgi:hypothetical protein